MDDGGRVQGGRVRRLVLVRDVRGEVKGGQRMGGPEG